MRQTNVVQYASAGNNSTIIQCAGTLTIGSLTRRNEMTTVSLKKDQTARFTASNLNVGVGWIAPKTKVKKVFGMKISGGTEKEVDLDLVTAAIDADNDPVRLCWYSNEDAFQDGTLVSDGDNTTGQGVGDDETHRAKLSKLPGDVQKLVFMVTAFKEGVSFADVEGVDMNVYNADTGDKLFSIRVKLNETSNAVAVATATRVDGDTWEIRAVNEYGRINGNKNSILQFAGQF